MSLRESQALLARLFTDAALRREFLAAREAVAMRFGLAPDEAALLATIDRIEVESFARSLFGKRALDARKAMPLTARALGKSFDPLLIDAVTVSAGHHHDCFTLARKLTRMGSRGEVPVWIADIARFECVCIQAARPGFRLRWFRYDVGALARALSTGAESEASPRVTFGLWARLPGGRLRWRLFRI